MAVSGVNNGTDNSYTGAAQEALRATNSELGNSVAPGSPLPADDSAPIDLF